MKKFSVITFLILTIFQLSQAQIKSSSLLTSKPIQFEKTIFEIRLVENWKNPYLQEDVAVNMYITSPSGKQLLLPCFYESGESGSESVWKAHFAPQEVGQYQYEFQLSKFEKLISSTKLLTFNSKKSDENGFLHSKNNWAFQFDNGNPFRGIGENICWESRANDDSKYFKALHEKPKYNYNYMLTSLAENGGNFFRTWMCSWNLPIDFKDHFNNNRYTPSDQYYNPSAIAKMDSMIDLCESQDLYIMLTLGPGAYGKREGGFADSADDFFDNPQSVKRYKNRLRYIVARWGYSTSIGAWEFFNEVDNVQFRNQANPIETAKIVQWHNEMSTYLKKIDPYGHLTTTSISHRDLDGLNSIKNIDFNQKHIYKHTDIIPDEIVKYEKKLGKPYVIGEFGYEWDWSKNFNEFADEMDFDFKRGLWYGMFSPTPILPLSWWWEFFDDRRMTSYFKGVREMNDQMLEAGNGEFQKIDVRADGLQAFGVQCGKKLFVYLLNESETVVQADVLFPGLFDKNYQVEQFDPALVQYKKEGQLEGASLGVSIRKITLNAKDELILILSAK